MYHTVGIILVFSQLAITRICYHNTILWSDVAFLGPMDHLVITASPTFFNGQHPLHLCKCYPWIIWRHHLTPLFLALVEWLVKHFENHASKKWGLSVSHECYMCSCLGFLSGKLEGLLFLVFSNTSMTWWSTLWLPWWSHCKETLEVCNGIETHHVRVANRYSLVEWSLIKSLYYLSKKSLYYDFSPPA
jgi:hypothetical protein